MNVSFSPNLGPAVGTVSYVIPGSGLIVGESCLSNGWYQLQVDSSSLFFTRWQHTMCQWFKVSVSRFVFIEPN